MTGPRTLLAIAALSGFICVAIGAFGAHGLPKQLETQGFDEATIVKKIANLETGARYQMYHTLAILAVSFAPMTRIARIPGIACWLFVVGIVLFSGGLYSSSMLDKLGHWSIVPIGGLFYLIGWLVLFGAAFCPRCNRVGSCNNEIQ